MTFRRGDEDVQKQSAVMAAHFLQSGRFNGSNVGG